MTSGMVRAKSLFLRALEEYEPDQWPAFLDVGCAGDGILREQVEKLLQAHCDLGTYHAKAAGNIAPTLDTTPIKERTGTMIGRYKLVHEIGEGGMGSVFMAVQKEPVKRKVALKIIKPGMDTKEVVARFNAERQALALMDHQGIATVLDGGSTESGRPYFVMELVEGTPINEYCDACRYTTRQRLELFVQVCQSVQHAHLKGVIHRDIKPSNILVTTYDTVAVPKVIDFGIAKAVHQPLTDQSLYTNVSQMIGTPLYMSPEQAQRTGQDVDTRTDVYSLGVLLYELLTGTTPFSRERFKESGLDEVKRIIREEEPPKPSARLSTVDAALETITETHATRLRTLTHELSGELDWIVMRALEKDRSRRYESVNELAKDVQRYLDDEPVEACPPSSAYLFRKFYRRNKVALLTAVAFALVLILGAGVAGWQAVVATNAKYFAKEQQGLAEQRLVDVDEQRKIAQRNLQLAEKNFQLAFDAVDQMLTEVASDQLKDVPQARKALLEKALTFYVSFLEDRGGDPKVRFEAAQAQQRAGEILKLLGEHERAEKHCREAVKLFAELSNDLPDEPDHRRGLLVSLTKLAELLRETGQHKEARSVCNRGREIAKKLADQASGDDGFQYARAQVLLELGKLLHTFGELNNAESLYQEALGIAERLASKHAKSQEYRNLLVACSSGLASLFETTGRLEKSEAACKKSLHLSQQLVADFPSDPKLRALLTEVRLALGKHLQSVGDFEQAESNFNEVLKIQKGLVADYPAVPKHRACLATSFEAMAILFESTSRHEEAETAYRDAKRILEQLTVEAPNIPQYRVSLADSNSQLAMFLANAWRHDEAQVCYLESQGILEKLVAEFPDIPSHRDRLARVYHNSSVSLGRSGKSGEAESRFKRSLEIERQLVQTFPTVPTYRRSFAYYLMNHGLRHSDREEAKRSIGEAMGLFKELAEELPELPRSQGDFAMVQGRLAQVLWGRFRRRDEAEMLYRNSLAIYQRLLADYPNASQYRSEMSDLSKWFCAILCEYRPDEAEEMYRRAVESAEEFIAASPRSDEAVGLLDISLRGLLQFLQQEGRLEEQEQVLLRKIEIAIPRSERHPDVVDFRKWIANDRRAIEHVRLEIARKATKMSPEDPTSRYQFGARLARSGQHKMALVEFDEAIRLDPTRSKYFAQRARAHIERGDTDQAIGDASQAIELDAQCVEAYAARAMALMHLSEYSKAELDWAEAVRLTSDQSRMQVDRGLAYGHMGQTDDAIKSFAEAIRLDPESSLAYAERGFAYSERGDQAKAQADWLEAMRLDPICAEFYLQWGDNCRVGRQLDQALEAYGKSIQLKPQAANSFAGRGECYLDMERFEEALADYREAIRINPNNVAYQMGLLGACAPRSDWDWDRAIAIFTEMIEQYPDDPRPYANRGNAHCGKGDLAQAVADYTKAIELDPNMAELYQKRGDAYQAMGESQKYEADHEKAIDVATELIEHEPDNWWHYVQRARAYLEFSRFAEVVDDLNEVHALTVSVSKSNEHESPSLTVDSLRTAVQQFCSDEGSAFQVKAATLTDLDPSHQFTWRKRCDDIQSDHFPMCGYEWIGDRRNFVAFCVAEIRQRLCPGLMMLSYPSGNVLTSEWDISIPANARLKVRWALTDTAVRSSRNGLRFKIIATHDQGEEQCLVDSLLETGDDHVCEQTWPLDASVKTVRFVLDTLDNEFWDTLWFYPEIVYPESHGEEGASQKDEPGSGRANVEGMIETTKPESAEEEANPASDKALESEE